MTSPDCGAYSKATDAPSAAPARNHTNLLELSIASFYHPNTRYARGMNEETKNSHALDTVTIFEGSGTTAEIEALGIQALLESDGIRVVLGGETSFPSLPWSVGVSKADAPRALQLIEPRPKKGGPKAAAEAEAEQEQSS